MPINYKDWNVRTLGNLFVLGLVVMIFVGVIHIFISPLLMVILPSVFAAPLTITETLLFLLVITLLTRRPA